MNIINSEIENFSTVDLIYLACKYDDLELEKNISQTHDAIKYFESQFSQTDIKRALPFIYDSIFTPSGQKDILMELDKLLVELKKIDVNETTNIFKKVELFQHVLSCALWKYNFNLLTALEDFAREFDRIDDDGERIRIVERLKNKKIGGAH